jgi:hypothetical protein
MVVGIVSGLVTGGLIYVVAVLWRQILVPWYHERVYNGIKVAGTWRLTPDEDFYQVETIELAQAADRLSGRLILQPKEGQKAETRSLELTGSVRDGFVLFTCVSSMPGRLGFVAYLGQVCNDGSVLDGYAAYLDTGKSKLASTRAKYEKDGS